ncbi:alpha/beta hydrolase [Microlunatus soli]|uniref:Alpha/beta hydrolase fold n=1 Tax=Microlunatus soli TaxID=630515 RepID=A0A1H1MLI0_9ACTN|nr:alpha/beta hydrolase [Microlunatus soli]SDR87492.1 alpha/beta hydrolase fold [Microlunatus soli]
MDRTNRGRIVRGLAMTLAAAVGGSLTIAPAIADDVTAEAPTVSWGACPKDVADEAVGMQCAEVPVPLDYDQPDGTKITVMISRVASAKPADRLGVLMLNPGGPGLALSQPADMINLGLPTSVTDSYDLIGMDPRGIGHSTPVHCGFTAEEDYRGNVAPWAKDAAAVARQAKAAKAVAERCAANDKDSILPHLSTANIARDMDHIRGLLGEKKISYYGASYGTALGSTYASMFPERTDRVVIDSNLGATTSNRASIRRFGLGMEDRFGDFATYLAERHDSYGLGRTPGQVRKNYLAMGEKLDQQPIAGVDGALFRFTTFASLYGDSSFLPQARLWQSLVDGDESAVRRNLDHDQLAGAPGVPPVSDPTSRAAEPSPYDNIWSAYLGITCNDSPFPRDVRTYQRDVAQDRKRYPLFGAASANITPCAYWPEPAEKPATITDDGPANILILQNLRDPATPHRGGELARAKFGDRARLVSIDQGGHGAYVYNDNACGLDVTTSYLVDGTFPDDDVFCPATKGSGLKLDAAGKQRRADTLKRLDR